jgi:adenine-specific DNA-methyltransferase
MNKEQTFYAALKDIFVGAKVEGESGYINLMKIKSAYFEKVFAHLKKDVDESLKKFPEFREELFEKLYTFFNRYFSETGSIYFSYTPIHQNVYEKVYTDDKDVMLFWKTHMLYYVKTDRIFKNLEVEKDGTKFFFDVSKLEYKKANEKRDIIYEFKERRKDGTLVFNVYYSEKGKITKIDNVVKELKKEKVSIDEETLEAAFRIFEKQNEVDYFINKNAKEFLKEQLSIWLYQYVFTGESEWTEVRIKQLQTLKSIATKIIDFISQFEDELVKIWNKPKFVLNSNYIITLDRIAKNKDGIKLIEKILRHKGFDEQVKEWKQLGIMKDFNKKEIFDNTLKGKEITKECQYLPIDTKNFGEDIKTELLSLFDNLDAELDGWLIHSENYQALNTILPKFKEKVKCIYIDPPYNSPSTEIIYKNNYKNSSWLTLMENRINLSKMLLNSKGCFIAAVDENEQERLGLLLGDMYSGFEKTCIAIVHNPRGIQGTNFSYCHDYAYFVFPKGESIIGDRAIPEEEWEYPNLRAWGGESTRETGKTVFYPIYVKDGEIVRIGDVPPSHYHPKKQCIKKENGEVEVWPIDQEGVERKWRYSPGSLKNKLYATKVKQENGRVEIYMAQTHEKFKTNWVDPKYDAGTYGTRLLTNMGIPGGFTFPKSLYTVKDCLYAVVGNNKNAIILDFFAGSGTTAHATALINKDDKGNRKFILVEMADYFDTVLVPRVKKVAFSFKWNKGEAQDSDGIGIFCKYYDLEQYEETLSRVKYEDSDFFESKQRDPYNQYVFMRDIKMLEALEVDLKNNKVKVDLSKLYENVDVAETLSNLTGKWIKKITPDFVEFHNGERINLKDLDYRLIKPLIWW